MGEKNLPIGRNLKIGTFHLGSTMADVLGSGVWNRVMIKELGYAATPVGLLLALRYFLAPLAVWAGNRSDRTRVRGYRRLPWIWGGRLMMVAGYILVAVSTVELVRFGEGWWLGIILGFLLVSIGNSISGSTFLALIYDRAPAHQRGRAVGIVWTFLLTGYAVAGILFARLFPEYSEGAFLQFFLTVGAIMTALWFFALWGEERRLTEAAPEPAEAATTTNLRAELQKMWEQPSARLLMLFMLLSFLAAFMQDALLEPFGGKVFDLSVGETTRFQAFWGTTAILSSIGALWGYRRFKQYGYHRLARWGVLVMILTFSLLAMTAMGEIASLLRPSLLLLGLGYGLWNIGTLGLMIENSREDSAGLDLGVWTVVATLCRGGGVFAGTVLFDLFDFGLQDVAMSYGLVFLVEALLLVAAFIVLNQMTMPERMPVEQELVLNASLD